MSTENQLNKNGRTTALVVGGLVAAVLAFALAKESGWIESSLAKRAVGMIFGAILIVTGNFLPKIVEPLNAQSQGSARTKAVERFAGRTFVLSGILYIAVWVFAPGEHAMLISSAVGLIAFALVGAIFVRIAFSTPSGNHFETEKVIPTGKPSVGSRTALLLIFHALFWVFAMFFADSIWGDKAAPWMVVGFVIANGLLVSGLTISRPKQASEKKVE